MLRELATAAIVGPPRYCTFLAGMEKLVDSGVSKAPSRERVSVRVRLPARLASQNALLRFLRKLVGVSKEKHQFLVLLFGSP